jgi:hypothetical protein
MQNKFQPLQIEFWFYKLYPSFSNHNQVLLQMVFKLWKLINAIFIKNLQNNFCFSKWIPSNGP